MSVEEQSIGDSFHSSGVEEVLPEYLLCFWRERVSHGGHYREMCAYQPHEQRQSLAGIEVERIGGAQFIYIRRNDPFGRISPRNQARTLLKEALQ